jgi:hypothetical protein
MRRSCPKKAHQVGECGERRRPLLPHWAIQLPKWKLESTGVLLVEDSWMIWGLFMDALGRRIVSLNEVQSWNGNI